MINPISPASQGPSGAAPMNEAVVRFGATQEMREQQRLERVSEDDRSEAPVDRAVIESSEELAEAPGSAGAPPKSAEGEGRVHHQRGSGSQETAVGGHAPEQEGLDEQQQSAIAQHAAEQQGKRELGRHDVDRSLRSTREMIGRVPSAHGTQESTNAKSTSSPSHTAAPNAKTEAHHAGSSSGSPSAHGGGGAAPRGHHAASTGGAAPRIGGDVIAAAVSSGIASSEVVAPGTAHARDRDDDAAQSADSSDESVHARHEEQGKKVARERALDGQTSFHDGDGNHDDSNAEHRFTGGGGHRTGGQEGASGQHGQGQRQHEDESVPLEPPPAEEERPAQPVDTCTSPRAPSTEEAQPPAKAISQPCAEVTQPGNETQAADGDDAVADKPARGTDESPDTCERTVVLSPGLELLGRDEYFFFDDARVTPDPPAEAS